MKIKIAYYDKTLRPGVESWYREAGRAFFKDVLKPIVHDARNSIEHLDPYIFDSKGIVNYDRFLFHVGNDVTQDIIRQIPEKPVLVFGGYERLFNEWSGFVSGLDNVQLTTTTKLGIIKKFLRGE